MLLVVLILLPPPLLLSGVNRGVGASTTNYDNYAATVIGGASLSSFFASATKWRLLVESG